MIFKKLLFSWIVMMVPITGLSFLVYASIQQNFRQSANDPQIQMAEDAASILEKNWIPAAVVPRTEPIDMKESLAPFIMVFDDNGMVLESSVKLGNRIPSPPLGVFQYLKTGGGFPFDISRTFNRGIGNESRLTWQPEPGVRIASVIVRISGAHPGFVLAGRSLREVESREDGLGVITFAAWIMIAAATLVILFLKYILE